MHGTVSGMGGAGIIAGGSSRIEGVRVHDNGGGGIGTNFGSVMIGNIAYNNGSVGGVGGISCFGGQCLISGNISSNNNGAGIQDTGAGGTSMIGNEVSSNVGGGLAFQIAAGGGYANNVLNGNGVSNGVNMGHNVCGGALCP
jgi:hypothetical protein